MLLFNIVCCISFLLLFLFCCRDPSDPDAVLIKRVLGVAGDYVKYVGYFHHFELSRRADAIFTNIREGGKYFFFPHPLSLIPFTF